MTAQIGGIHPPASIRHPRPILIAGPTAVGKSEVALLLAEQLGGEIISVDSMQVYRGLDIGTAKPSPAGRACVPHHLIDVVDLADPFDAAKFVKLANAAVAEVQSRGRVPILCGGTGLYFRAFLEGLSEAPPTDATLRAELNATPLAELLRELEQCDPATFARIDRQNPRRVIRAVAVIRLTGKPFSTQRARWEAKLAPAAPRSADLQSAVSPISNRPGDNDSLNVGVAPGCAESNSAIQQTASLRYDCAAFGLTRAPDDLRRRIDARVDQMFARGLVEETRRLLERGLAQNENALQAIGYRQVVEHLRGERSLAQTVELVKTRTRKFAKRQMTWFRGQMSLEWIEVKPDASPESAAALVKARSGA